MPSSDSSSPPIYTVGHGAASLDQFVEVLRRYGIAYLIDVRSKPYSRHRPEFNREQLERHLHELHIRYVFMGDLLGGLPDDPACYTAGRVDYEKVRAQPFHRRGLERLRTAWEQRLPVALMCACGKPERCHRSKLIGISLEREGLPVVHLDDRGTAFDHHTVMALLNGNPDLFGQIQEAAGSRMHHLGTGT